MPLLKDRKRESKQRIRRVGNVTELWVGKIFVRTNLINRYRFNELRKKRVITPNDFLLAVRRRLK